MIQRFEDEYPECRLNPRPSLSTQASTNLSSSVPSSTISADGQDTGPNPVSSQTPAEGISPQEEESSPRLLHARPSQHGSDVSLASRALSIEEGRMHRFGQQMRRDIFRPRTLDHAHGTTGLEPEPEHIQMLRQRLETLGGMEIKERVMRDGPEAVMREISANAEELQRLAVEEPECFEAFRQAQEMEERSLKLTGSEER